MADDSSNAVTVDDIHKPFWLDRAFLAMVIGVFAPIIAAKFGITLNTETVAADIVAVVGYIVSHKLTTTRSIVALIEAQAKQRYIASDGPKTLPDVAKSLDPKPATP